MAKKDAASKRLAEEIAFAELLKRVPPLFTQEELLAPPAPEELPPLLRLGDPWPMSLGSYGRDAVERPILDAFEAFSLDHRSLSDWRTLVSALIPQPLEPALERLGALNVRHVFYRRQCSEGHPVARIHRQARRRREAGSGGCWSVACRCVEGSRRCACAFQSAASVRQWSRSCRRSAMTARSSATS